MPRLTPEPFPEPGQTYAAPAEDKKWRLYEKIVADMQESYADCSVIRDHKVTGVRSGVTRQVDVWVTGELAGHVIKVAIECKLHKTKVNIKSVDSFVGLLEDVGADKGVMVTTTGFTDGAEKRARAARIELNVMTLESAMETDWADYLGDRCRTVGACFGNINWGYSEGGPCYGTCTHCGQLHFECGECGEVEEYDVACDRSIGNVHVRCKNCNACFLVGVEKGEVIDISACPKHKK